MGALCCAPGTEQERAINSSINQHMKQEDKARATTHKILLLGPGDSGKTTILKQMRKIHDGTIPADTVDSFATYIRQKMVHYMKILCSKSIELEIPLDIDEESDDDVQASRLFMAQISIPTILTPEILTHIKLLWPNNGIQQTLAQRERFQIPDNVAYFFNERLDDISCDGYIPSFEDYLRIRMRTTGINTEEFITSFDGSGTSFVRNGQRHTKIKSLSNTQTAVSTTALSTTNLSTTNPPTESNNTPKAMEYKDLDLETAKDREVLQQQENGKKKKMKAGVPHKFIFMDVGGQRAERKKWIGMLTDSIDAVVYVVAISEYDLVLFEEATTNRLKEALALFENVCKKGFMTGKTVTLFFNKYDLLVEKLQDKSKTTIKDHFPEFPGDENDARDPVQHCEFVYTKFLEVFERCVEKEQQKQVPHYHRTSALDTDQIDSIMADMQSDLIRNQLKLAGF